MDLAGIDWLQPWHLVEGETSAALERRLALELGRDHRLFGKRVRAVARRQDCDDVLYEFLDSGECAVVHLTWTHSPPEKDPRWPGARVFASLTDWANTQMIEDHEEFGEDAKTS